MEKVLVEMGTATWSSSCASEVQVINQMKENGLNICVLNYHLNDPFANQQSNQRAGYYGIQNLPFPLVGGVEVEIGNYNSYLEQYNISNNFASPFGVNTEAWFSEDSLLITIYLEKLTEYESDSISIYIAVTESNIPVTWHGLTEVDEVERAMTPDGLGTHLDFSDENMLILNEKILFNRYWNPENMELLVFIQDDTTKQILQCHSKSIVDFSPLPVHSFFTVADTMSCKDEFVQFENISTGDIEEVHWTFEGGIPSESDLYHPSVKYNEEGAFNVTLMVSNTVSTDTLSIDQYIHIQALPEVSFDPLPELCNNLETYELIEGHPIGGDYFGLFVDTGYFHPQTAGIGTHLIYYSYQEESTGCSDTINQEAVVHLCPFTTEKKPDGFPFLLVSNVNTLELFLNNNNNIFVQKIEILNLNGQQIAHRSYLENEIPNYLFSIPSANSIIIIIVHTPNKDYLMKYKMLK